MSAQLVFLFQCLQGEWQHPGVGGGEAEGLPAHQSTKISSTFVYIIGSCSTYLKITSGVCYYSSI